MTRDSLVPTVAEEADARKRAPSANVFQAAVAGAFGGLVAGLAGGVPYFLAYQGEDLPWRKLAGVFFTYVMLTGAVYAAGARGGVALVDRWRGGGAENAVAGGVVGAALVGPLPGAVGVAYFGSQPYVFMGTAMLALAPIAGALLTSAWIALADRRAVGLAPSILGMLVASLAATAIFGAVGALIFYGVDDESMLAWFREHARSADRHGDVSIPGLAFAGVEAGAILGTFIGAHVGVTLAFARKLTRR